MLSIIELQQRQQELEQWLKVALPSRNYSISFLAGDASFRRYFRIHLDNYNLVAMDAPPALEDSHSFVAVSQIFGQLGLSVPKIIDSDLTSGFLLISDLGDDLYFKVMNETNFISLYSNAIEKLNLLQECPISQDWIFPAFDGRLFMTELTLFKEWYLEKHLQLKLTSSEVGVLNKIFTVLIESALAQPQVCVHRDYHSRNLFALPDNEVGIIDFQDALWGPVTYDLVSLLRDCYLAWPEAEILQLAEQFYFQARSKHLENVALEQFMEYFDWMGMQRHLKAIYIFARKWHRDGNDNYLNDIPRTLNYIYAVCKKYSQFSDFRGFLEDKVLGG